ncbi:MAG: NDP-sugar synthase [Pseudomonadota bacterium]
MITVGTPMGDIEVLRLIGPKIGSQGFRTGRAAIEQAVAAGRKAILLDLRAAQSLREPDLARLVELAALALPRSQLSLINVPARLRSALQDAAIDQIVPVFSTMERALEAPAIRRALLARTPAIVLSGGKGSRMSPLTQQTPKPMLEIMGRPVLEHILSHLGSFGVQSVFLNPGHLGPQIPAHFEAGERSGQAIFYANEGFWRGGRWVGQPVGSASTLGRLAQDHNCLRTDTIVMCGDALVDVDFAAMMACHRDADADVTIAALNVPKHAVEKYGILRAETCGRVSQFQEKPRPEVACSTLANTGIYILSPRVAAHLSKADGFDIAQDLLPSVLQAGGLVQAFRDRFRWVDIGCGRDYMAAWSQALAGTVPMQQPDAEEVRPGLWVHPSASIGRLRDIEGPAFVSAGAHVESGASLRGPVVLGADSLVEKGAFVRNSILTAGTHALRGALVDGVIASGGWAVSHAFADGSDQPRDPIDHVTHGPARAVSGWGRPDDLAALTDLRKVG